MAGRKLTRQQAFRIKKVQEERLARAQKKAEKLEAGVEGEAQPGVVITRHGASAEVAAMQSEQLGEPIRCHLRANLGEVVCGDRVSFPNSRRGGAHYRGTAAHPTIGSALTLWWRQSHGR